MKKSKIKHYDETNYKQIPRYKRHIRRRRKEKFCRFVSLPTVICCIVAFILSSGLLTGSYFLNEQHPWFSNVFVSTSCGILTGVTLYFFSNLRNSNRHRLEHDQKELWSVQTCIGNILGDIVMKNVMKETGQKVDVLKVCDHIAEKLEELRQTVYEVAGGFVEYDDKDKNSYGRLWDDIQDLIEKYDALETPSNLDEWLSLVYETLKPFERGLQTNISKNRDQIDFLEKTIF